MLKPLSAIAKSAGGVSKIGENGTHNMRQKSQFHQTRVQLRNVVDDFLREQQKSLSCAIPLVSVYVQPPIDEPRISDPLFVA